MGIIGSTVALVGALAVTAAVLAGASPNAGTADVNILAANPDHDNQAALVIEYYSTDGTLGPQRNDTLDPLNARNYTAASAGFSGSFRGVAIVSSDRQLGVVATTVWNGGETRDGIKYGQYAGVTELSDTLYFPNVVYDTYQGSVGVQNTTLSIQNASASEITAYVSWTNLAGDQDFYYTVTVPANGAIVMDTSQGDTDPNVPDLTSTAFWSTWDFWSGGVVVTSTQSVLAGAANVVWRQWAASYTAVSSGATTLYFPSVERREYNVVNNGRFGGGSSRWGGLSTVAVTNLDPTTSTVITFTFIDSLGLTPNRVYTAPLAAGGTVRLNTHTGMKIGSDWYYDHDDMLLLDRYPTNAQTREWVGSVIVESGGPEIVGTCNNLFLEYNKADLYEATPDGGGHLTVIVPDVYRRTTGSTSSRHFSLLRIQNTSSTTATLNVHFYDRNGNDLLQFVNYQLGGLAVATPNLNRSCFGDGSSNCTKPWELTVAGSGLGDNYAGWIEFTSDQPIAVTVENWFGGSYHRGMGAYNGWGFD
jgi:hypothetical protein